MSVGASSENLSLAIQLIPSGMRFQGERGSILAPCYFCLTERNSASYIGHVRGECSVLYLEGAVNNVRKNRRDGISSDVVSNFNSIFVRRLVMRVVHAQPLECFQKIYWARCISVKHP